VWFHGWTKGVRHEEAKFDAYKAEQLAQAATELNKRLTKQTELQRKNEGIANDLIKAKQARAADAAVSAGRLRDYTAALGSARNQSACASGGTSGAIATVSSECPANLETLDRHLKNITGIASGLQQYVVTVCLK
jgi:hypothetical protein